MTVRRLRTREVALATLAISLAALFHSCRATSPDEAPALALQAPIAHAPRTFPIDVEHYAIAIALDPIAKRVDARCTVRFWPVKGVASIEYVELDLAGLEVTRVRDADGRELVHRQEGETLAITLAEPLEAGHFAELAIDYGGVPHRGLWFVKDELGAATQVFTQGECADARAWFPCLDEPFERATSEVIVTMPKAWTSVAAGVRVERTESATTATEAWRMDVPHPAYLETLVAGELAKREATCDGVPLEYVASNELAPLLEPCFAPTPDVLEAFAELTGARYPYPKYAQACVANFPFGGMENVSATTLTETTLTDERGRKDGDSTGLIAHEAAHQWFGDLLTCADWSHVWLNEGFATYFGALYAERTKGTDAYRLAMRGAQDANVAGDGRALRPIVSNVYRRPMDLFFTGHVYQGGAARLGLLRGLLGDDAFFRGIALYVGRNRDRAVTTADLRAAMEEASGLGLARFFEQWFERPGHPELAVAWRFDADRKLVVLDVEQTQSTTGGVPDAFFAPAEVEIATPAGKKTERVELSKRRESFELACDAQPTWVLFDARGWIPKRCDDKKRGAEWLAIARDCDEPVFRCDALRALSKLARDPNARLEGEERERVLAAVIARAHEDRSDAVRQVAATELGDLRTLGGEELARTLLDRAEHDDASAVRTAALDALAKWGPNDELARFAEKQFDAGWSWNAMGHAALLRCAAHPASAFDWLAARRPIASPHGVLEAQLVGALASVADPRAKDELVRTALDEKELEAVRASAVNALTPRVDRDRDVADALLALLGTDSHRVRRAAVQALATSKQTRVRRSLVEHSERTTLAHEQHAIQDALDAAASRAKGAE